MSNGAAVYVYNAEGQRAQKIIGASSCSATTGSAVTNYVYDLSGHEITEVSGAGVWNRGEVYAGGQHIATYANSTTYFNHSDWLGTERARTTVGGALCETISSLPFGDNMATSGTCGDPSTHHFTGKERDSESNLDDFLARYDSSALGRLMSPDPAGMFAVRLVYPQTLNHYSYVLNNPLSLADPLGLDCAYLNNSGTDVESVDQDSSAGECGKTHGYWVDGTLTQASVDPDATTISLQGTTNGADVTSASYLQNTTVNIGWYINDPNGNSFGHIALGIGNNTPVGLNPRSDWNYGLHLGADVIGSCIGNGNCYNAPFNALSRATVPGAILPQTGTPATQSVVIPITGTQATLIQNAINQSTQYPPPYSIFGSTGCDCGTWAQGMLSAGGVPSGSPAAIPQYLIQRLSQIYGPH